MGSVFSGTNASVGQPSPGDRERRRPRNKPVAEERDLCSRGVIQEKIRCSIVLDIANATWDAYDNRSWPARYLIDADGFIRYKHFGEGAYEENGEEIRELLSERDEISN